MDMFIMLKTCQTNHLHSPIHGLGGFLVPDHEFILNLGFL